MPPCVRLERAATLSFGTLKQPVITRYQLGVIVFALYRAGEFQGQPLCTRKEVPNAGDFRGALAKLTSQGVLAPMRGLPAESVFAILGREDAPIGEIACAIDPFAFMSHLSAMEFHGLTDRLPKILYLTTPPFAKWKDFARRKMEKDCGPDLVMYQESGFPMLTKTRLTKLKGRPVHQYSSIHLGAFKTVRDSVLRVATIGRTFLDMLRQPDLCGGIRHAIDVYRQHADTYLRLITDEITAHGQPIDKVRAGYILEEVCEIQDPAIEQWLQFAQRGGSRKLDSSSDYSPQYSERWCLSVNIEAA